MNNSYYTISVLLLVFWIGVWAYFYFRKDAEKYFKFNTKALILKNKYHLIGVVLLFLFPFIWVNFVVDDGVQNYKKVKSKLAEEYSEGKISDSYDFALKTYPTNEYVHIDYIQHFSRMHLTSKLDDLGNHYKEQLAKKANDDWLLCMQSIAYNTTSLLVFENGKNLNVSDTNTALYHYAKALEVSRSKNFILAEFQFLEAMKDPEMREFAYPKLEYLWYQHFSYDEVKSRAYNWDVFQVMPFGQKKAYYIEDGAWNWYLYNGLHRSFLSADLLGYIAVFLSVLIWGLFIYKMLFINRNKLLLMFSLFTLGSVLPILVYVFSDLLRFLYSKWEIELDHFDFWYNFVNIGMVEELVKFLSWFSIFILFKNRFKRPVHFMLLPIVSALGFAFSENLIYINSEDYEIIFIRGAICIAIHMSCSAVIGYALFRGLLQKKWYITLAYGFVGFILASLVHGLYDYFIFTQKSILTILVFLIGLHLFILFVNNVLNFSSIKSNSATKQLRQSGILLMLGLILVFCCQYMLIGIEFGRFGANSMFKSNILFVMISMIYLVSMFRKIRIRPNVLYQFSFMDVFGQFFTLKDGYSYDAIQYEAEQFKLFAPKTNLFVGSQMPVTVTVERHVEIQFDKNWVVVKFDKPITVGGCYRHKAVMKCKNSEQELYMDKVEVLLLFIPDIEAFEFRTVHHSGDFKYAGKVYSRPLLP